MCVTYILITRSYFVFFSGLPSQAFEYIMYNKGLMTEEDYPYKAIVTKYFATNKLNYMIGKTDIDVTYI